MEVKGILHAHSNYSYDAKLSLRELKSLCREHGLSFVCMTEHTDELTKERAMQFVDECGRESDASFMFIPGFEVPYRLPGGAHAHVLMIGMRSFHEKYAPNLETLKPWTDEAEFVVLAHPVRNQFDVDDGLLGSIDALEVWNQQYEGKRAPRTRSLHLFGALKKMKPELLAIGGVDLHRKEHIGAPIVTLSIGSLSEADILEKLKVGAFTVSSPQALLYGTLPNPEELARKHRLQSFFSVTIIVLGKLVNSLLAGVGISLPKSLKQYVRRSL